MIVYGRGPVPELVRHGENGWIVDGVADAVAAVAAAHTLDRARIRASVAQRFSREHMVESYLQLYKGIT